MQWLQILVPAGILWLTVVFTATKENHSLWNQPNPMVQFVLLLPLLSIIALGVWLKIAEKIILLKSMIVFVGVFCRDCALENSELQRLQRSSCRFAKGYYQFCSIYI